MFLKLIELPDLGVAELVIRFNCNLHRPSFAISLVPANLDHPSGLSNLSQNLTDRVK